MSDHCVFCWIVDGTEAAHVLYEDADAMAFLDIAPIHEGHTIVIPRTHRRGLTDMDEDEVAALYVAVRRVAEAIEEAVDPEGMNAIQSSGDAAGQDVYHAHVHLIPRYEDDKFGFSPPRRPFSSTEMDGVAGRIRDRVDGHTTTPDG